MSIEQDVEQYKNNPTKALRDSIVMSYYNLVIKHTRKYVSPGTDVFEEVVHEGIIGVVKALDRFDASLGVPFTAFVSSYSLGCIKAYFRERKQQPGSGQEDEQLNEDATGNSIDTPFDNACYLQLEERLTKYLEKHNAALKDRFFYWYITRKHEETENNPLWKHSGAFVQSANVVKKDVKAWLIQRGYL